MLAIPITIISTSNHWQGDMDQELL
jgi:hypothetical protein